MSTSTIARRYARAALSSLDGEDVEVTKRVDAELQHFASLKDESEELRQVVHNPAFTPDERSQVIAAIGESAGYHASTLALLKLLIQKGRIGTIDSVAASFTSEVDRRASRVRVTVSSSRNVDESTLSSIIHRIETESGKKASVKSIVEPNHIGGLQVHVEGKVWDNTIQGRLNRLKFSLANESL